MGVVATNFLDFNFHSKCPLQNITQVELDAKLFFKQKLLLCTAITF